MRSLVRLQVEQNSLDRVCSDASLCQIEQMDLACASVQRSCNVSHTFITNLIRLQNKLFKTFRSLQEFSDEERCLQSVPLFLFLLFFGVFKGLLQWLEAWISVKVDDFCAEASLDFLSISCLPDCSTRNLVRAQI